MTRLWPGGDPIRMETDHLGRPRCFHWRGRRHPVAGITNRWRVDAEWWRLRIWRDYYLLTTCSGLLVIVYHDRLTSDWLLQRLYD